MAGQNKHAKFARDFTCLFSRGLLMSFTIAANCLTGVATPLEITSNRSAICSAITQLNTPTYGGLDTGRNQYVVITKTNTDSCTITYQSIQGKPRVCKPKPSAPSNYNLSINYNRNIAANTITAEITNSANKVISTDLCLYIRSDIYTSAGGLAKSEGNYIHIPIKLAQTAPITPQTNITFTLFFDGIQKNLTSMRLNYKINNQDIFQVIPSIVTATPNVPLADTTYYSGTTMGNVGTAPGIGLASSPVNPINITEKIYITIFGTIFNDTRYFSRDAYYANGVIEKYTPPIPPPLVQSTTDLTIVANTTQALNLVDCNINTSLLNIPANRRLYICIKYNQTTATVAADIVSASTNKLLIQFYWDSSVGTTARVGFYNNNTATDAGMKKTERSVLLTTSTTPAVPSAISSTNPTANFYIDPFSNASFIVEIYDALYPDLAIARGSWTQVNANIPAGIYTIRSLNDRNGNFRFIGVGSASSSAMQLSTQPVLLSIRPDQNGYDIISTNNTPLKILTSTGRWYTYNQFVNTNGTLSSIGTGATSATGEPIRGEYTVALLKDTSNMVGTDDGVTLSFVSVPATSAINTAKTIFTINRWSNPKQELIITNDIQTYSRCTFSLKLMTDESVRLYSSFPESMQIKIDISGGSSQTLTISPLTVSSQSLTLTYGNTPYISINESYPALKSFTQPIMSYNTFTLTVYILDPSGNPVSSGPDDYFARGTLVGIVPPAKADGQIIREEADNGTRVKFELPAGKTLLADTLFMFTATSTNGSTSGRYSLDSNVANATSFTLEFYKGSGRDVAAFNINNKSYEVDSRSSTLNYYSSLTLYAYRPAFAASATTDYDYKFTSDAIPEPSLEGTLSITASTASSTTLTGQTSASLPGRTNKFPRYMKLYLKAKNETRVGAAVIYNCTTDADSFIISILTPTSTATTEATIKFGSNDPVSLGTTLTSADIFELFIDDAISPTMYLTPDPNKQYDGYFQKYTYTPQSVVVFGTRSSANIAGSIIQSVTRTAGYRPIPRTSTFEFAIQGTGSAATQTTTASAQVSLTEDVTTFTLAFSVGTGAAQLIAGTQTVGLTGVTLYNYQTFTLSIKDSAGTVFATGVSSSECRWDECKAALEEARTKTYLKFDAKEADVCKGCFLTDVYDPCKEPGGDCVTEQERRTASFIKWSGSDIPQCHTCGTLKAKANDPCQSALCAAAKSRAASAYQPYSASDLRDCDYCPPGTGGADSYDPCAPGGRCDQLIQEAKVADIKFTGSQYLECQACPAFQAMTNAPRPMTDGTAEIAANGFAVKLALPAATPFPLKANAFISIAGKSYDIPGGYTITGTAPTEAYMLLPSIWSQDALATFIIDGKQYAIPGVTRELLNRYTAFDFYVYQPSYDRTEYYAKFSYAGYTPTDQPIQLMSAPADDAANFTLSSTAEFPQLPNSYSLHVYKNGVDIWNTVDKKFSSIDGMENEQPSLNPQKTFNVISVKYGEPAVLALGDTTIPLTGQTVTAYDDIRIVLADLVYNPSRNPSPIIGRQKFVVSTTGTEEPNMSGSLGLAGENTVAGDVSPTAPGVSKKFPMKMRIYVYAKDNSIRKTVDYTCKTVSTKFAISTTQATSTATPADSTITFEGQGNPAVSLGVALTTADTLALVIDDALTRPPTGSWPAGSQYFQSYSFTPPSFIEFAGRTTTGMRGLVKQTNSAATAGYRAIPAGAMIEVVVQSSNNTTTLTATLPAGAPGASEFTIGFTTGNEEARVKVGTADISLGGTLYQYQSFAVTIKNSDGSVFAAGVNATGCDYAKCTEALGKLKAAKQPYNAADVPECKACLQTEVYNPCETPSGECIMEQKRLTDIPKKWSGSEILACQACGSMRDSAYDPCRSASCVAAKAQTASSYKKYTASDFEECNYCPPGTGGADTYDPCSASGDCETIQAALTASNRGWEGKDLKECQQCGSLKEKSFYPCFSEKCRTAKSQAASSYKGYSASDFDECDHCPPGTGGPDTYDPCSASGPCERRQAELTALGIAWSGADLKECKYCSNLAGSWAPPQPASASVPTASASVAPVAAPAPAAPTGGGIFAVFQGVVAPTPVAAAPRPPMPLKPIKPVPTYTPAVQERTVRIVVNEKKAAAAKAPVKRDFCVDGSKGFLANLVCEIREDVVGVGGKVKQAFGLF